MKKTKSTSKNRPVSARTGKPLAFTWRKRDAQDSQLYNLQLDINDLKQEIRQLEAMRALLQQRIQPQPTIMEDQSFFHVAIEYNRVFGRGYYGSYGDKRAFVESIMDPQVQVGRFYGTDCILDQLQRYSSVLALESYQFLHARMREDSLSVYSPKQKQFVAKPVVVVDAPFRYDYVMTRKAIEWIFPHILHQEDLVQYLLAQRIVGYGQLTFTFDLATHKVIKFDVDMDFFNAFAHILRDPHQVLLLMNGACVTEEYLIGEQVAV